MGSQSENEPSEFMTKMKKTVFVDNVSGLVTDSMIRKAFEQFGTVVNISFIPDYLEQNNASKCVLVEMENEKKAKSLLVETSNLPFMLGGMPRPIRCRMAEPEMFSERPRKSDRKMTCRWIQHNDPDFEVAKRMKEVVKKHEAEAFALRKEAVCLFMICPDDVLGLFAGSARRGGDACQEARGNTEVQLQEATDDRWCSG
ncbi:uncharacterized protein LOC116264157 isoform X2 [Nymphaea colorata]|uniref:uncharacterized protein LOC116264157 isoform X2 n=1 Tax=Nymphaea colorata TaxID=210225 RepID=UPI00129D962F|nr:uncharacterized protein LOC116264157 isoform X2 [Nymphaea colorata]